MNRRRLLGGVLTAVLALLPFLYLRYSWDTLPALVPVHFTNGQADGFTGRQGLRELAWLPVMVYVVLTLLPQVSSGQFGWWRSPRQRQLRAVLVAASSSVLLAIIYRTIHTS